MHILHTHFFTVHLVLTRRIWLEITMFFPASEKFSSIFSLLWLILITNRIYRGKVNRYGSLLGVKSKLFLVITTENKRSDRHFKYFIIVQNFQLKSKMVRCKNVTALVFFFNARKGSFPKPRKLQFPLCLANFGLFWFLDLWTSGPKVHDIIIFKSQWGARIWFAYE